MAISSFCKRCYDGVMMYAITKMLWYGIKHLTLSWQGRYHLETSPYQWTGFYMTTASVMKELMSTRLSKNIVNRYRN